MAPLTPSSTSRGGKKGRYCKVHKKEGMVNVTNKRCEEAGCTSQPVFNVEGGKRGRYCKVHKKEGMVDVTNKRMWLSSQQKTSVKVSANADSAPRDSNNEQ